MKSFLASLVLSLILCSNTWAQNPVPENIIIGDSLCTFIDNASQKASRLSPKGDLAGTHLWFGGTTLTWLKKALLNYPVTPRIKHVVVSTGTNSAYAPTDDIEGLVSTTRSRFPYARIIVVPGSWWIKQPRGWVVTVPEEKVKAYYQRFEALGVKITSPVGDSRVCCNNDPHGNFPIYKTIGAEIDAIIDSSGPSSKTDLFP